MRLEGDDGQVGWGETYLVPGAVDAARAMAKGLVGREPALHRLALGAVSMALDDLRARRRGVAVSALYGDRRRGRVRAYASSRGYLDGISPEAAWGERASGR